MDRPAPLSDPRLVRLQRTPVIGIVRTLTHEGAREAVRAAIAGGLTHVEITMGTPGALDIVHELRGDDRLLVGVGTVLDDDQADAAIDAGAQFVVSPVTRPSIIGQAKRRGVLVVAGALTPNEILGAWEAGADVVKVFPAGCVGGPTYFRMISRPLPGVRTLPTGGVTVDDATEYLSAGAFAVGLTSGLFPEHAIRARDWPRITALTRRLLANLRVRTHLGQRPDTSIAEPP